MRVNYLQQFGLPAFENGWPVVPLVHSEKKPLENAWTTREVTRGDILRHVDTPLGVGIRCGNVVGIDNDYEDDESTSEEFREALVDLTDHFFPHALQRRGRANRPAMRLIVLEEDEVAKSINVGKLQILGKGRQFVSYNTHPDTRKAYLWLNGGGPAAEKLDDQPKVSHKKLNEFISAVQLLMDAHGIGTAAGADALDRIKKGNYKKKPEELRGDRALLTEACEFLYNPDEYGWDEWVHHIMLPLWAASNGADWGLELAHKVSSLHNAYDEETTNKRWEEISKSPPNRIGAGSIYFQARMNGWREGEAIPGSEFAYAEAFVAEQGGMLRYVAEQGKWRKWDGHRWEPDRSEETFSMIRHHLRGVTSTKTDQKTRMVLAVERLARADRRVAALPEHFDSDPWLLNTPDGIVDLRTGKVRPCDPAAMCSKITAVSPAPAGTRPLLWEKFLRRVMSNDQQLISYLQCLAGYCLTGMTTEEIFVFAWGTGKNGKTKYFNTLRNLMGDYAMAAPADIFLTAHFERHPTELAGLMGSRFVTASEISAGQRWNEARLKMMTGGDPIKARFMRQDFFEYVPQFKLALHGNNKPTFSNVDDAIRRRIRLIPFEVTIPEKERDKNLESKLKKEWPAILRWAINGCLQWQRHGLQAPKKVLVATKEYLSSEDHIASWMSEHVRYPVIGGFMILSEAFEEWVWWSKNRGVGILLTMQEFKQQLLNHGLAEHKKVGQRGFKNVQLKRTGEAEEDDLIG